MKRIDKVNIFALDWTKHKKDIYNLNTPIIEVDGSVNRNPGHFGIVGIYDTKQQSIIAYKYRGQKLTNQLMELLAIYHGLEHHITSYKTSDICIISDSLTTINSLAGIYNTKNPKLAYFKNRIEEMLSNVFDVVNVYLVHRRGHTKEDHVGRYISYLVKFYNKTQIEPQIPIGSLQSTIDQFKW